VAYRHLQKLEDMGFLAKDAYGEYVLKDKARVRGYVWAGRRMMPKMLVYSLIFLGILIAELVVLALHYSVENYSFKIFFLLLALVTGAAMAVFVAEGLLQRRRIRQSIQHE
jgi:predicted RND superfamily exporter protein